MKATTKPINWNAPEDALDQQIWDRVTSNFWLDTKIPLSNDIKTWATMTDEEKLAVRQVFAKLTLLDTLQSELGAPAVSEFARTQQEKAVLSNFTFMESVHAKSYSSIFSTLCSTEEINDILRWVTEHPETQAEVRFIEDLYKRLDDELYVRAASVLLESFLFYSGFFIPFHFASKAKLTNTADLIRLIVRDEGVHGLYIGYKFQQSFAELPEDRQDKYRDQIRKWAMGFYELEAKYTEQVYDPLGLTETVKTYIRYNANKAMQNLGFEDLFPASQTRVEPRILTQMSSDSDETHDFFSGAGSSYVVAKTEETDDDDWA